jgi:hypothetical protein
MRKGIRLFVLATCFAIVGMLGMSTIAQASSGIRVSRTVIGVSGRLTMNTLLVCDVLLELSLNNVTLLKTTADQKGTVSRGSITNCNVAGGGTILTPIPIFYNGFSGTLPNISRIDIRAGSAAAPVGFQINNLLGACGLLPGTALYGGSATPVLNRVSLNVSAGTVTGVDFTLTNPLNKFSGTSGCPATATIRGTLSSFLSPGAPTVALI